MIVHDAFRKTVQRATERARQTGERTGQALFNILPLDLGEIVAGTSFDPFHRELSFYEMITWLDDHLIIEDSGEIVAVYHGERILWEKE